MLCETLLQGVGPVMSLSSYTTQRRMANNELWREVVVA
jgi:hypothetical protein